MGPAGPDKNECPNESQHLPSRQERREISLTILHCETEKVVMSAATMIDCARETNRELPYR